jgi:hypothetical protein
MGEGPISNHLYTRYYWVEGVGYVAMRFYTPGNGPYYRGTA